MMSNQEMTDEILNLSKDKMRPRKERYYYYASYNLIQQVQEQNPTIAYGC